jgi:hypothetical protein
MPYLSLLAVLHDGLHDDVTIHTGLQNLPLYWTAGGFLGINEGVPGSGTAREQSPQGLKLHAGPPPIPGLLHWCDAAVAVYNSGYQDQYSCCCGAQIVLLLQRLSCATATARSACH